jgi:hypothetical protein
MVVGWVHWIPLTTYMIDMGVSSELTTTTTDLTFAKKGKRDEETKPLSVNRAPVEFASVTPTTLSNNSTPVMPIESSIMALNFTSNNSIAQTKLNVTQNLNNCPRPKIAAPEILNLPETSFVMLHLGKGGGGTVGFRLRSLWLMNYTLCHMKRCHEKTQFAKFVGVNIRDPVDRFVSSYYWKIHVYRALEMQWPADYLNYKDDVNLLAEALCSENETQRNQALIDMKAGGGANHGRFSILDWLPRSIMLNRTNALIPIVLEKGVDFEAQIDATVRYVYDNVGFEGDPESFAHREEWVGWHNCKMTKPGEGLVHSTGNHSGLSKLGEKCMARYFADDYKLIKDMLDMNVCKTDDCRIGLKNILKRRLPLLQE